MVCSQSQNTGGPNFVSIRVYSWLAFPIEDDFAGLAAEHHVEAFLKFAVMKVVCDHWFNVEAALEHDGHFVPGLVHFASVNAFDGEHRKNNCVPVDGHFLFWN